MSLAPALRRHWPLSLLGAGVLLALAWGALAPLGGGSHALVFEVPRGAHLHPGGLRLPAAIRLTLGVQDVLLLRNRDTAPLVFGPVDVAPGGEFRLALEDEGEFVYACPAVEGGRVVLSVVAAPGPGWERLRWRLGALVQALRYLPLKPPEP